MLLRGLPLLVELALTIFCLIDCIQTPEEVVRNLPRWAWIVLILLFPIVGGVAWLIAGRPVGGSQAYPARPGHRPGPSRPLGPDDDPEFLREIGRVNAEHESMLEQWERDLKRREEELRRRDRGQAPDGE